MEKESDSLSHVSENIAIWILLVDRKWVISDFFGLIEWELNATHLIGIASWLSLGESHHDHGHFQRIAGHLCEFISQLREKNQRLVDTRYRCELLLGFDEIIEIGVLARSA